MKKIKQFPNIVKLKRWFIENLKPKMMGNYTGKCFTRDSPLTMGCIVTIILRGSPFSSQLRLDDYFKEIDSLSENLTRC